MARRERSRWTGALFALVFLACPAAAAPTCKPVHPVPCDACFAVAVLPDTQHYTLASRQPHGAAHLDLITRYLCDHRTRWIEPRTGKTMPILMAIHLGDLVHSGDLNEHGRFPLAEWKRVAAAFDNLDACEPVVPYLVTDGNHDIAGNDYQGVSEGYDTYFGARRWIERGYQCREPGRCDWDAGEWFIGGGDPIAAMSRNRIGPGSPGPPTERPGRHRAGVIRTPRGQRLLFVGLEQVFDFPPAATPQEGNDARWVEHVLNLYRGTPTVMFNHSMFWTSRRGEGRARFGPEIWAADSLQSPGHPERALGMQPIWDAVVAPHRQVFLFFSGHVVKPAKLDDFEIARPNAPPIHGFLRNFQGMGLPGETRSNHGYGVGWNVFAAFDPDAGEIRVRSYRIDDVESYADPLANQDHTGTPAPTECFDTDFRGVGERVIRWTFPV